MAKIQRELMLDAEELDELMTTTWNMRVATTGPGVAINLTPLWFGWAGGRIYFYCRGQKIVNLRRSPQCTVLVDRNEQFAELQGAMFQGTAAVLEDVEAENADAHLAEARAQMGRKYSGGHGEDAGTDPAPFGASARGRFWRWVAFTPATTISWDNTKLPS